MQLRKDPPEQNPREEELVCAPVCSPMQTGQAPKWVLHARQDLAVVGKAQSHLSMHRVLFLLVLVMWRFPLRNGCGIWLLSKFILL